MEFHRYISHYEDACRSCPELKRMDLKTFYARQIQGLTGNRGTCVVQPPLGLWADSRTLERWAIGMNMDMVWYNDTRPYYKVYPSIVPALNHVSLDVKLEALGLDQRVISVRFAKKYEPIASGCKLHALLSLSKCQTDRGIMDAIVVMAQYADAAGELREMDPVAVGRYDQYNETLEDRIQRLIYDPFPERGKRPNAIVTDNAIPATVMRLAIAVHLLANDSSIVEPEVLTRDRCKYAETQDHKYVIKAKKRGVVGWTIGREYETVPHYRRPHFGLRWTGKGRKLPRIVPIKGSVVHRQRITTVPTGWTMPNGTDVEPVEMAGVQ